MTIEEARRIRDLLELRLAKDMPRRGETRKKFDIFYAMKAENVSLRHRLELAGLTLQDIEDVKLSNVDDQVGCPRCHGKGQYMSLVSWFVGLFSHARSTFECGYCDGTGRVWEYMLNAYYDF